MSNEIISLVDAKAVYNGIINISPNTTNAELKKTFPIVLARMKKLKEQSGLVFTKKPTTPKKIREISKYFICFFLRRRDRK